ncbi:hypothetical protein FRB94_008096 [Tulasnella sp. JGI-2019a]|nr:hypothetical protein FRB94_008096 [Tulasnella sp. JGI-2019a]
MSASVSSDRSNLRKRGTMLAYIFANQGWGSLMGSVVFLIVLQCYKGPMNDRQETSKVDGVWRIVIGVSLVPAFGTLYQRLTLPEATRYTEAQNVAKGNDLELKLNDNLPRVEARIAEPPAPNKAQFSGANSNQNVVLQEIGFDGKSGSTPWEKLYNLGIGSLIITALGFVPGYYVTVLTVEYVGRKNIQLMGFIMEALFLGILAGKFYTLNKIAFIVNFALLQFFFNFGANTTTYMYPAEVFPTRFKAFAHGISAACGKAGAIVTALAFNVLNEKFGTPLVLWILVGCCLGGASFTLLLPEVRGRDPDVFYEEELVRGRQGLY